ncbi:MAG: DUF1800 domain-containing protein [Planctomycetota bacterium]
MQATTPPLVPPGAPARSVPVFDPSELLLARATFGYTRADAAEVAARGIDGWLDWQLRPAAIDDSALDVRLAAHPWLRGSAYDALADPALDPFVLADRYKGIRLLRAVHTRRQLLERIVEFWSDHFSVFMGRFTRIFDDRTAWRPHALGRFRDLLGAVTRSASMIAFLDNDDNVAGAPNENLAREIFELHTLGVDGPYTEADVREFARCLTGWHYQQDAALPTFGTFHFDHAQHDTGPKDVLGLHFPGGSGAKETEAVLDLVASHPSTIDFVTSKLARWLLGDGPPSFALDAARTAWSQTDGDIEAVVRALLTREALRDVLARGVTVFRRPFDWLAATLRATGVEVPEPVEALDLMRTLGQAPFEWPAPDGYPVARERWVGHVQPRWAIAAGFARAEGPAWKHVASDFSVLVLGAPRRRWATRLDQELTGGRLSPFDVAQIQAHVDALGPSTPPLDVLSEALELTLSCPSYQVT